MTSEIGGEVEPLPTIVVLVASTSLGVVALALSREEIHRRRRMIFLNFALFFFFNGIDHPIFKLFWLTLLHKDAWLMFYFDQYHHIAYFFMLLLSIMFVVCERVFRGLSIPQLYLCALLFAGVPTLLFYRPYFADPDYAYASPDAVDFRKIRIVMENLAASGVDNPSVSQITERVHFQSSDEPDIEMPVVKTEERIREILPFFHDNDYRLLLDRPLWTGSLWMSILCVLSIGAFFVYQYQYDPPGSAYVEKIVWCLLLYCLFEAFHMYAYTRISQWPDLVRIESIGYCLTATVMAVLSCLLLLRLRFLQTIEGRYYEQRLEVSPSRITRWRDVFDNWVLRQFMNPGELEQRFVVQAKGAAKHSSSEDEQS